MDTWGIVATCLAVVIAIAWYLSYTAARLDRLHARVEGSLAALDAQLVRRAEAALELAHDESMDPASAVLLASAAGESLEAAEGAVITEEVQRVGVSPERAAAEEALTQTLQVLATDGGSSPQWRRVADVCDRVDLAYRFHDEAVRDVRRVRAKPLVRLFHLAGRTHLPEPLDVHLAVEGIGNAGAWR